MALPPVNYGSIAYVRWCHQAYDQGALLTQLDFSCLAERLRCRCL